MPPELSLLDRMTKFCVDHSNLATFPSSYTKLAARLEVLEIGDTPLFDKVANNPELVGKNEKNLGIFEVDINKLLAYVCAGGMRIPLNLSLYDIFIYDILSTKFVPLLNCHA